MAVVADLCRALGQGPAHHEVRDHGRLVPQPEHGRAHGAEQIGGPIFQLEQHRAQHRPRCVGKGAQRAGPAHGLALQRRRRLGGTGLEPLDRTPAGVGLEGIPGMHGPGADGRLVGPGGKYAPIEEPFCRAHRGAEEDIVVEIEEALGQARNAVHIGLDMGRVEGRQRRRRDQVAVVDEGQPPAGAQPGRRLGVGHDIDLAVLGKVALERAQAVAQLIVVAEAALDIAIGGQAALALGRLPGGGSAALAAPSRVIAVDPQVDDVDSGVLGHGGWQEKQPTPHCTAAQRLHSMAVRTGGEQRNLDPSPGKAG